MWQELVNILQSDVPAGSVTTYASLSLFFYGVPHRNQPVRAMLVGAHNHGFGFLTNRVVRSNGALADLPAGPAQKQEQLAPEGVSFDPNGRVDFNVVAPVQLQ